MGAFGRRLHARLDAQRDGREADRRALVSGGRQRARPRGEGRAQSPEGAEAHARLRQELERDAGRARNRLRHHRAPADLFPGRPSRRGATLPQLSRDGGGLLRPHQGVADHAHHRDEEIHRRRAPVGRAQSLQRVPGIEAPLASNAFSIPPCRATRCPG